MRHADADHARQDLLDEALVPAAGRCGPEMKSKTLPSFMP